MKVAAFTRYLQQRRLVLLLVCYFILHGIVVNGGAVPIGQSLMLLLILITCGLALYQLFQRFFSSALKTVIATFLVVTMILFFGVFQDITGGIRPIAWFGRLTIFLPLSFFAVTLGLFYLYRSRAKFIRLEKFLVVLLLVYIVIDVTRAARQIYYGQENRIAAITGDTTRATPDVYLIVLDEYLGHEGLQSYFNYANSDFQRFLQGEGFYQVKRSFSNYSLTVFSIASMLNMQLLETPGGPAISNHYAYKTALEMLGQNRVCDLFSDMGYNIRNKSPFYVHGQAGYDQNLLPQRLNLLQHQTLYYRVGAALPDLLGNAGNNYFILRKRRRTEQNNHRMMQEVLDEAVQKNNQPKFTYLHLMMPHEPFLRDSLGRLTRVLKENEWTQARKDDAYLQYLVYTNKMMATFLKKLKSVVNENAVIILTSDHGSRHVGTDKLYLGHNTIHSVYAPGADTAAWYSGLSNVNTFPVLFRELYGIQLQLQSDSLVASP